MFNFNNSKESELIERIKQITHERELEKQRLEQDKELALKEKEFELRHFKDEEVKKLEVDLSNLKQTIAVLRKENEMLDKITNLNADIIDIKDLVNRLIEKLPTLNLKNLTIHSDGSGK